MNALVTTKSHDEMFQMDVNMRSAEDILALAELPRAPMAMPVQDLSEHRTEHRAEGRGLFVKP